MTQSVLANMDSELRAIREKIDDGIFTMKVNDGKRCSGNHWNTFRKVFDEGSVMLRNMYACSKCPLIIRSDLNKEGTAKLRCHHKQDVKNAVVKFIVNDMRPVDAVTKIGLVNLLALFTQLGAHYGQMNCTDVAKLLPSRFTVSNITPV